MQTIEIAAKYLLVGMHIVYGTPEQRAAEPTRFAPHVITGIEHRNNSRGEARVIIDIVRTETLRSAGSDVDGTWTRHASQGFEATANVTVAIPDSPFVMDASNPTDDELAAAIERGLADGSLITAEDFLARVEQAEDEDMTEAIEQAKAGLRFYVVCEDGMVSRSHSTREEAEGELADYQCNYEHTIVASATKPRTRYDIEQAAADEAARLAYEEYQNDEAEANAAALASLDPEHTVIVSKGEVVVGTPKPASMFASLTEDELTTLYRKVKHSRDILWTHHCRGWESTAYEVMGDMLAIMHELHELNQNR